MLLRTVRLQAVAGRCRLSQGGATTAARVAPVSALRCNTHVGSSSSSSTRLLSPSVHAMLHQSFLHTFGGISAGSTLFAPRRWCSTASVSSPPESGKPLIVVYEAPDFVPELAGKPFGVTIMKIDTSANTIALGRGIGEVQLPAEAMQQLVHHDRVRVTMSAGTPATLLRLEVVGGTTDEPVELIVTHTVRSNHFAIAEMPDGTVTQVFLPHAADRPADDTASTYPPGTLLRAKVKPTFEGRPMAIDPVVVAPTDDVSASTERRGAKLRSLLPELGHVRIRGSKCFVWTAEHGALLLPRLPSSSFVRFRLGAADGNTSSTSSTSRKAKVIAFGIDVPRFRDTTAQAVDESAWVGPKQRLTVVQSPRHDDPVEGEVDGEARTAVEGVPSGNDKAQRPRRRLTIAKTDNGELVRLPMAEVDMLDPSALAVGSTLEAFVYPEEPRKDGEPQLQARRFATFDVSRAVVGLSITAKASPEQLFVVATSSEDDAGAVLWRAVRSWKSGGTGVLQHVVLPEDITPRVIPADGQGTTAKGPRTVLAPIRASQPCPATDVEALSKPEDVGDLTRTPAVVQGKVKELMEEHITTLWRAKLPNGQLAVLIRPRSVSLREKDPVWLKRVLRLRTFEDPATGQPTLLAIPSSFSLASSVAGTVTSTAKDGRVLVKLHPTPEQIEASDVRVGETAEFLPTRSNAVRVRRGDAVVVNVQRASPRSSADYRIVMMRRENKHMVDRQQQQHDHEHNAAKKSRRVSGHEHGKVSAAAGGAATDEEDEDAGGMFFIAGNTVGSVAKVNAEGVVLEVRQGSYNDVIEVAAGNEKPADGEGPTTNALPVQSGFAVKDPVIFDLYLNVDQCMRALNCRRPSPEAAP